MSGAKKKKKEDLQNKEIFDQLDVELHKAESAVLLLKCPEDDVKIKACEALFGFIYKSEENVKKLLSQSFVEQLFSLLKSEDAVVRRNTTMVFGILSGYLMGRVQIRKLTNLFPILLKLLQDDLDTTKEFALMTIKNMCQDYTCIHEVLERRGLPLLIDCLRLSDPDVQKNAIDALYLIMQDFEARPALKSANGLAPIVDLLDSEYPVIQESALRTLMCATHDASIRNALLDTSVIDKFVKIVGNPELNDLHASALGLIANMLEDPECAKVLINTGRLQLLLHYVTDKTVYKESELTALSETQNPKEKAAKGKKSAAKGSPRKRKGEVAEAEKDKTVTSITPEAKIHACQAIMRAAYRDDVRKILHDADAERMLAALLSHEDEGVRSAAANTISVMAESFTCQERFFQLGTVELLIRFARGEHRISKSAGVTALASLTKGNSLICREVASRNSGLEALVTCLQPREPEIDTITVGGLVALTNIALDETTKAKVAQVILGKPLALLLRSSSQNTLTKAAMAIAAVAYDQNTVHQFVKHGGLDNLLKLLDSQSNDVRRAACWAIYVLSAEKSIAKKIANVGGIITLQNVNLCASKRNQFSEVALLRLLDAKLEVKFALTGYLDYSDHVGDVFYDRGPVQSAADCLSISEYMKQPLTDSRPVYLFSVSSCTQNIPDDPGDADSQAGKQDSNGMHQQPAEDAEESAECDEQLLEWSEQATNGILPIGDPREQATELGRFVANCIGGEVNRDDFASYRWELGIAEVRREMNSNVVPIGKIKLGGHLHRALLFKFLADRIGLPTNLTRGEYGRSYNEILLQNDTHFPIEAYTVDLMFEPGRLMKSTSTEAREYTTVL